MLITYGTRFSEVVSQALRMLLLGLLLYPSLCLFAQSTSHVTVAPTFRWPESLETMAAANRMPTIHIEGFYNAIRKQIAHGAGPTESIRMSQFRFARLGEGKVCLATTGGERFPWLLDIVCPSLGGFEDTTLLDERMDLLVTDLLDLDGDGFDEVISSEFAAGYQGALTPPIYWYTIYGFRDGLPHDVSRQFRRFYEVNVLGWGYRLERLIMPPLGSGSKENNYIQAQITFTRLKYQRKILGEAKAGLQEAMAWAESEEVNLQVLAVTTFREIDDAAAITALRNLSNSKNQGVCRAAVSALAAHEHREVTGQELESKCKGPTH